LVKSVKGGYKNIMVSIKNLWLYFPKKISEKQSSDSGMAIVLIFLLMGLFSGNNLHYKIAIPVLIINMTFPRFYYLFAIIWLGLTKLLGTVVSKIILTLVYIILVIPVGVFRRLLGNDSLQLNDFKKDTKSVFKIRNHIFSSKDMENPY
jgi:hypothetical protein